MPIATGVALVAACVSDMRNLWRLRPLGSGGSEWLTLRPAGPNRFDLFGARHWALFLRLQAASLFAFAASGRILLNELAAKSRAPLGWPAGRLSGPMNE